MRQRLIDKIRFRKSKELGIVKENRRGSSLQAKKARTGWLFILPFILGFFLVYLPIIFGSLKYSFSEIEILTGGGYDPVWVGFANYKAAFQNSGYMQLLGSGLLSLFIDIIAIILFSLFIAIILNQKMVGRAAFRAIFFIPVLLTTGLIASIDASNVVAQVMDSSQGIDMGAAANTAAQIVSADDLQNMYSSMLVGGDLAQIISTIVNNIFDIVNRSGVQILIFLAGLQGISPAIYESCEIEGASAWETFWKITLPMISPMILVNAVYTIIDSFTSESNQMMQYVNQVYKQAGNGNVLSSAMAWIYFLIVIAIVAVVAFIVSRFIFYQKKD